jgi:ATP-dependent Clp protease ATP-binding subunit ClpA
MQRNHYFLPAQRALSAAREEATKQHRALITTGDLLIALYCEINGGVTSILGQFVPDVYDLRQELLSPLNNNEPTSFFDQAIAHAADEARTSQDNAIKTGHLLLGLLSLPDCSAVKALVELRVDCDDLCEQVRQSLGQRTPQRV